MFKVREAIVRYRTKSACTDMIGTPEDVWRFFSKKVAGETREAFYCLYLNQRNRVLCYEMISVGTSTSALVDRKAVIRTALLVGADSLILVHNHPSGECEPSLDDNELTMMIDAACKLFGIKLLDHVVIGDGKYSSLKERGVVG